MCLNISTVKVATIMATWLWLIKSRLGCHCTIAYQQPTSKARQSSCAAPAMERKCPTPRYRMSEIKHGMDDHHRYNDNKQYATYIDGIAIAGNKNKKCTVWSLLASTVYVL